VAVTDRVVKSGQAVESGQVTKLNGKGLQGKIGEGNEIQEINEKGLPKKTRKGSRIQKWNLKTTVWTSVSQKCPEKDNLFPPNPEPSLSLS